MVWKFIFDEISFSLISQQKSVLLNPNIQEGTFYARSCIPLLGLSQGVFIALIYGWEILAQFWGGVSYLGLLILGLG